MSLKIRFLQFHIDYSSENLGAYSKKNRVEYFIRMSMISTDFQGK